MTSHSPVRILLVDDDEETREMLTTLIRVNAPEYRMTAVEAAEDAFTEIREQHFDLYILDYMLTGISGVELCTRIRESDRVTPVILFTAVGDPYVRDRALEAGANAFLRKARDLEILLQTADELLHAER